MLFSSLYLITVFLHLNNVILNLLVTNQNIYFINKLDNYFLYFNSATKISQFKAFFPYYYENSATKIQQKCEFLRVTKIVKNAKLEIL